MKDRSRAADDARRGEEQLSVVIQAGGESRRMGRSKATVPFLDEPLLWRSIRRMQSVADELIVTTNEPDKLTFLQEAVEDGALRLHRDILNKRGALTGLHTALAVSTRPFVAVVACDMIFASAPLAAHERDLLVESGADVAIPHLTHGYEPFHAVYNRESCLRLIEDALMRGESRASSWFPQAEMIELTSKDVLRADPRGGSFVNVNTPEELAAMEKRIRQGEMTRADQ